jgi:LysM repeat protein
LVVPSIGIKIANGEFFPILPDNAQAKKRLVLTTVRDDQQSTQIDLYQSAEQLMADAQYIGTLLVEELTPRKQGEPSVELIISSDGQGVISAEAKDLDNPVESEGSHLSISLDALHKKKADIGVPEFDLEVFDAAVAENIFSPPDSDEAKSASTGKSLFSILMVVICVLVLAALTWVWFFHYGGKAMLFELELPSATIEAVGAIFTPPPDEHVPAPPLTQPPPLTEDQIPAPAHTPHEEASAIEPTPIQAPRSELSASGHKAARVQRERPVAPVLSYKVPSKIPKNGIQYKVRWGDTLWDISQAFYHNPRLYRRIARYNGIKNPNKIIPGRIVRIPPR